MRTTESLQAIVFKLGDDEFGIEITQVLEIDRLVRITRIPRVPPYVEGIINLRGRLVPVVDLRTRLGMPHATPSKNARIIVAQIGARTVGMIVDEVREVVRIPVDQIDESQGVLAGLATEYLGAVGKVGERLIVLIDVQKVLAGTSAEAPRRARIKTSDRGSLNANADRTSANQRCSARIAIDAEYTGGARAVVAWNRRCVRGYHVLCRSRRHEAPADRSHDATYRGAHR